MLRLSSPLGLSLFGKKKTLSFASAEVGHVDASTVVVTFTRAVKATNAKTGVTIKVNGAGVTVNTGTIQANKCLVYYALAAPVSAGNAVTWEYNAATGNILDNVTSVALPTTTARTVTNNLGSGVLFPAGTAMGVLGLTYSGDF
jgi:hypothetical protein